MFLNQNNYLNLHTTTCCICNVWKSVCETLKRVKKAYFVLWNNSECNRWDGFNKCTCGLLVLYLNSFKFDCLRRKVPFMSLTLFQLQSVTSQLASCILRPRTCLAPPIYWQWILRPLSTRHTLQTLDWHIYLSTYATIKIHLIPLICRTTILEIFLASGAYTTCMFCIWTTIDSSFLVTRHFLPWPISGTKGCFFIFVFCFAINSLISRSITLT